MLGAVFIDNREHGFHAEINEKSRNTAWVHEKTNAFARNKHPFDKLRAGSVSW